MQCWSIRRCGCPDGETCEVIDHVTPWRNPADGHGVGDVVPLYCGIDKPGSEWYYCSGVTLEKTATSFARDRDTYPGLVMSGIRGPAGTVHSVVVNAVDDCMGNNIGAR